MDILKQLQYPSGLLAASKKNVSTGYDKVWLRDNVYQALGFEATKNYKQVQKIYQALLDIFKKHEYKIDHAITKKPTEKWQYIHARYDPSTYDEFFENWGNKQNDAVGAILFKIGELESKGIKIIRDEQDKRILQKLVHYLESIEYWQDEDNGMWEENEEVHASSVGACVAGLKQIRKLVDVNPELITKGQDTLNALLPRESKTKAVDLALLSLIYPYNVVSAEQRDAILKNIEEQLVRERGVARYHNDYYYNKEGEAEWTMGLPWLAIIYKELNKPDQYARFMRMTIDVMNNKGELPELYYANTNKANPNTPLGWSQALACVMFAQANNG